MNKTHERRLLKAADIVEKADNYDQSKFYHDCGAPACVLGWYQSATKRITKYQVKNLGQDIVDHFGLNLWEAVELFSSFGCGEAKTGKAAAAYIRNFVKRKRKEK